MTASRAYLRKRRRDLAASGKCTACAEPLPPGHAGKECPACQKAARKRARARGIRIRSAWRALGKCYFCGGERVPGYTLCGYHLEQRSEAKDRRRGIKCLDCKNPVEPGKTRCSAHLEAKRRYMKARREPTKKG